MKNSCYGCTERTATCHSTCEKYLAFKRENEAKREAYRKMKEQENLAYPVKRRRSR